MDVTLYTLPLYKVNAHNYATSDDVLTNGVAINWVKNADQIMFVWWPLFNEVVVMNYTFVPANTAGEAWSNFVPSTAYESNVFNSLYGETAFGLGTSECAEASAFGMRQSNQFIILAMLTICFKGMKCYTCWKWSRNLLHTQHILVIHFIQTMERILLILLSATRIKCLHQLVEKMQDLKM